MNRQFKYTIYLRLMLLLALATGLTSCNKQILFQSSSTVTSVPDNKGDQNTDTPKEKVLSPDDKIMISIWDHDELSVGSLQGTYSLAEEFGKWVMLDMNGDVRLPQIGTVKLQGLTVKQAVDYLEKAYAKYIQNPVINIRVLNNQVTILGEVKSPGIYIFSADHLRLADIIGKAQGTTDYAKVKKVKVIRGNSSFMVDMTNASTVASKELTILPGDVIYIPPTGGKAWERFSTKLIPIASLITAIALVYSVTNKN